MGKRITHSKRHTKIGRPTTYSFALCKKIADDIAIGLTELEACDFHHLNRDVFARWANKYPVVNDLIAYAKAAKLRELLIKAREGKPSDACWVLEHTFGTRFARPETQNAIAIQLNNIVGAGFNWDPKLMETIRAQLNRLQAVDGKPGELDPTARDELLNGEHPGG